MRTKHKIWNEGTTQRARLAQPLTQKNFAVDERFFEVFVKYMSDYAEKIAYYNFDNLIDESWKKLIDVDEIVVLAQLRMLDVKGIETEYYEYSSKATNLKLTTDLRLSSTVSALKVALDLSVMLEGWLRILKRIPEEAVHFPIFKEWSAAIYAIQRLRKEESLTEEDFMSLYNNGDEKEQKSALRKLDDFFKQLVQTAFFLNAKYDKFLELSKKHQSHLPHHALLFAFIELFKYAQDSINTFHQRHLDYYYGEHLHLQPRQAHVDKVTLQFELEEGFNSFLLPENTPFLAGQDKDGNDLLYKTHEPLEINNAEITELRGIYVNYDGQNINGHVNFIGASDYSMKEDHTPWAILNLQNQRYGPHLHYPEVGFALSSPELLLLEGKRTITLTFSCEKKSGLKTLKAKYIENPGLIGQTRLSYILSQTSDTVSSLGDLLQEILEPSRYRAGFVVSDNFLSDLLSYKDHEIAHRPVSSLIEGEEEGNELTIAALIENLSEEIGTASSLTFSEVIQNLTGEEDDELLYNRLQKTLKGAMQVAYTTKTGWYELTPVAVSFENDQLTYILVIHQSFPGVEVNPELAYDNPTLKFTLNPRASYYGYDFFERLQIQKVSCNINVKNVKSLILYNQIGPVNADGPFLPFGPTPNNYSYFLIGNKEAFKKQFTKLRLNVDWMDLPADATGFEGYYRLYGHSVSNGSFKAKISNLHNGDWTPKEDAREELSLFEGKNKLKKSSQFQLDTTRLAPSSDYSWNPEELAYNGVSQRGFLKIQMTSPDFSFGHQQYPNLLSRMAIENAKAMTSVLSSLLKKKMEVKMPNQPYTPKIDKISLDYISEFEVVFDNTEILKKNEDHSFYHILPFSGFVKNPIKASGMQLIPSFDFEGALFMGVKHFTPPGTLTLFFNLKETDTPIDPDPDGNSTLDWHVLNGNDWIKLKPQQISSDTTDHLLHAGIVKLDIPSIGRKRKSSVLNNELFWIKVSARKNTDIMGEVIDISPHAVMASYVPDQLDAIGNYRIGPNTISSGQQDLPAIKSILQKRGSFGGYAAEEQDHFYVRVSERLRHKNRCVNPYDYERVVLEAFPEISKVLCIDAYDRKSNQRKSGKVLLVLVPAITDEYTANITTPSTSVKTLRKVRELLQTKISPFIDLDVINPVYEHMRVFADVRFVSGKGAGQYLKKLNEELRVYIAPWIEDPMAEPLFQRRFPIEDIQSFIQSRPYVDFVTKVSAVKVDRTNQESWGNKEVANGPYSLRDTGVNLERNNETRGRYPWSIVTTASMHHLVHKSSNQSEKPDHAGYEELYLNEDFVIREDTDI